jgi:rsbT co-antagonist protein RsbR
MTFQSEKGQALELTQEMLYSMLESSPNIVVVIDREGVIQFTNRVLPGMSRDAVRGTDHLDYIEPQYRELVRTTFEEVFVSGQSASYQVQGTGPNGTRAWYSTSVGPVRRGGEVVAVALFTTDITDRKNAELKLERAEKELITQQARAIQELSTPVIQVWDGILVLPLIGTVDTERGRQITENLLDAIVESKSSVAIIDITGVPVVDTMVAGHFLKTFEAARMLGATVVLTGVSPYNAQALVKLGVDLSGVTTKSSLQAGLRFALALTKQTVAED